MVTNFRHVFDRFNRFLLLGALGVSLSLSEAGELTLSQAQKFALAQSPELRQFQAERDALHEQAVSDGSFPDPALTFGATNVPADSLSLHKDEMSMLEVGLEQEIPPGRTNHYRMKQTRSLANSETYKRETQRLQLEKDVSDAWFELYYWIKAKEITQENHRILKELSRSTESAYTTGKINQQTLLQIQLERSALTDKQLDIAQQISTERAKLGRWIGHTAANTPLAHTIPHWRLPTLAALKERLTEHPLLQSDRAQVIAAKQAVHLAKEQYKPGVSVGMSYGFRGKLNEMPDMKEKVDNPDMVSAKIRMSLPILPNQRQTRQVNASQHRLHSIQQLQQIHYRDLLQILMTQYRIRQRLIEREILFEKHVLPETKQQTKAALLGYQTATVDFDTLLRSHMSAYQAQLQYLRIQIDRAKAESTIALLTGDTP